MKQNKLLAIVAILLANICVLVHNFVPHCHHDNPLCHAVHALEANSHHDGANHHDCNECSGLQWFVAQHHSHEHNHGHACALCHAVGFTGINLAIPTFRVTTIGQQPAEQIPHWRDALSWSLRAPPVS